MTYRIFGNELSPYSIKVRSYFRYKRIPHQWIVRDVTNQEEYERHAKLPLIPLVLTPEDKALQDSTPIIETMEAAVPEPSIHPAEPTAAFISALIEEYADEWGNKPMFHYRWTYEPDQEAGADRIARSMNPNLDPDGVATLKQVVKTRMIPRLALVGSSAATCEPIEASFHRQLAILERHLAPRPYLFGARPALGDFGLFAQLYECSIDPTPGKIIRTRAPATLEWIERMLDPVASGDFEPWDALESTLLPLLRDEVGAVFFPWSLANAQAIATGAKQFTCSIAGAPFAQDAQKYHAKSLGWLRERYARVTDRARLDPVLERANCLAPLRAG